MAGKLKPLLNFAVSFAILVSLSSLAPTLGQSGRRSPKPKTVIAPIPVPDPTPSPSPSMQKSEPALRFILGVDEYDSFSSVSMHTLSGIKRNCVQRMEERSWIRVTVTQRSMRRSDAIKLAKAEKESYVVWLQIREDTMSQRQTGTRNNVYIEFIVFAPETAKIMASGSTYPGSRNNVILDRRTSDMDGDYYLNRAARETADKILSKFSLITPRRIP